MNIKKPIKFAANIEIIGINPFVFIPEKKLKIIFAMAGKNKGAIPIKGMINDKPFVQHLVKYSNHWRLYINTTMLKNSPKRIGEKVTITLEFDAAERITPMHPKLEAALKQNPHANEVFEKLSPSRKKEIMRYINYLKTEKSVHKNVDRIINFLSGKEKFTGREKP